MNNRITKYLPLVLLPIIILACFGLWSADQLTVKEAHVETDNAIFDAREIDFSENVVFFNRCVEYIPDVMLTPEEFDKRDDIQVGKVPDGTLVSTMRIHILVPDDIAYGIAGYSVNYASSVYVNGKWLFDEGKPAFTSEEEESSEAYRVFSVSPIDGVIEILIQTSSFANIDTSSAMGWCIGEYENLRVLTARKTTIDIVVMAWYALIALVALLLFLALPKYKANAWLALLGITWVFRTGLKNTKFLLTLFPNHTWSFVYKVEIATTFVTIILFALILSSVFPNRLPKWFSATIIIANIAAIFYIIFMPWQTFLGHSTFTNPIVYWALALMCILVIISMVRRKEKPTLAQIIYLSGTALVLFAFVWDQGYFELELFPFSITQPMMLVFTMFMLVSAMLATIQKTTQREVELVHTVELQENEIIKSELELSRNRTAIVISQIQPHFLYNSLTSIEQTCAHNPDEARQLIRDFSKYLRGNMNALTQMDPISVEAELKHVETYLVLEKKRFKERLNVVFDVKAKGFSVPALTLQPIVENAIKHGVTEKREGGTITIRIDETPENNRITVTDDGVGFDPAEISKDGHVGIENVRHRIEAQCGGKLEISSSLGEGTEVTIWIPKK